MTKKFSLYLALILIAAGFLHSNAQNRGSGHTRSFGDTTVVQTLRFDTTLRAGMFMFPDDTSKTYEKIIMLYSMRCKNGLISNGTNTNLGCGEWDYNCYTSVIDSSKTVLA